jgi:predicted nucleic acid-binding protein
VRFWDSSAVVPLLVSQAGTERADAWFREDRELVLWTLTGVEIASVLWRLVRDGALAEADARVAEQRAAELAAASRVVVDVDAVKVYARRLLRVHALRATAALQLGAALVWAGGRPEGRSLCTLDERLASAAHREGFLVVHTPAASGTGDSDGISGCLPNGATGV